MGNVVDYNYPGHAGSSGRYSRFNTNEEAVDIIVEMYQEGEVVLGEFIASIGIEGASLEDTLMIMAHVYERIDDYQLLLYTGDEMMSMKDGSTFMKEINLKKELEKRLSK